MGSILAIWRIFARRGIANWPLLSVLGLGVLVASTLLAAAPVYARVMSDLAITFRIRGELGRAPATVITVPEVGLTTPDGVALQNALEQRIDDRIGWFTQSEFRRIVLGDFWIEERPGDRLALPFVGRLQSFTGYEDQVSVAEGRLPAFSGRDGPVEVAIGKESSASGNVKLGDTLSLWMIFDTCERPPPVDDAPPPVPCNAGAVVVQKFPATVVGIIGPADPESEFWPAGAGTYFLPRRIYQETNAVLPLFTSEETLVAGLGSSFPGYRPSIAWHVFPDPTEITRTNFARAGADLEAISDDVEPLGGFALTPLRQTLASFAREVGHKEAPLFILLLEISGVALFYVLLMSLIVVERQAGEIAVLRARGASALQVLAVYLLDGLLVGVPVMIFAPLLAALGTSLLGILPSFSEVGGGGMLPVRIPLAAFGMAAAGVALSLLALGIPVFLNARRGVIAQRRAEARPGASFVQRYYLDLAAAAVAALLLWELYERGSVFTPESSVGLSSDPLLLASPVLLIGGAAALLMRFVPLGLRALSKLIEAGAGVAATVGLWQVARNSGQYTRLALLLMMAVAVGTFAASYASTTERSYRDRAQFEAGVEWRATSPITNILGTDGAAADRRFAELGTLERWTTVTRMVVSPAAQGTSQDEIQLLGVEPPSAARMLWFRKDFADRPLSELLGLLGRPGDLGGRALPRDSQALKLWVHTESPRESTRVWARIRDENRNFGLVDLGTLTGAGWRELRGDVYGDDARGLSGAITLLSVLFTEPLNRPTPIQGPVTVDDISVVHSNGSETTVEDFETGLDWQALPSAGALTDKFERTNEMAHGGRFAGRHTVPRVTGLNVSGFYATGSNTPLPAVVSNSFRDVLGVDVGSVVLLTVGGINVPVEIRDTFSMFPTLPASDGPSVVVNRDHLEAFLQLSSLIPAGGLNELWAELADGASMRDLEQAVRSPNVGLSGTVSREAALAGIRQNPLIAAGGGGILFVSFAALLVLVTVALLVSLWVAVQRRRAEFAVLRAMGLSRRQVLEQLICEYAVVAIVGLAAGAYLGLLVGRRMLGFLNVTERGDPVEPSFVLQTDWLAVFLGGGSVLAGFAAALLMAVLVLSRTSDAAALRRD